MSKLPGRKKRKWAVSLGTSIWSSENWGEGWEGWSRGELSGGDDDGGAGSSPGTERRSWRERVVEWEALLRVEEWRDSLLDLRSE